MEPAYREDITSRHPAQDAIDKASVLVLRGALREALRVLDDAAMALYREGRPAMADAVAQRARDLRQQIEGGVT